MRHIKILVAFLAMVLVIGVTFSGAEGSPLSRGAAGNNGDKTYTHNSGLTLHYPGNWTLTENEAGIIILPGDVKKNAMGQPLEVLFLLSIPAQGITSVNSPQVPQFIDMLMNEMYGNLQRQGEIKSAVSPLGEAVFFQYQGTSKIGIEVAAGVYCVLYQNYGICLMHAASKELYPGRVSQARKIFSSIKMGSSPAARSLNPKKGPRDNALVGTWTRQETSYSSDYSGGGMGSETNLKIVFQPNGVIAYGSGTWISGDSGNVSVYSGGGQNVSYGTWTTSNGFIHVKWQDGSADSFKYSVFEHDGGLALEVITADGKKYFIKQ